MNPVLFYVPNLIGYARIITAVAAYYYAFESPQLFFILYTFSFVADAADGMAARALNQCSRFGAVLDMVTDRAATSGLLVILAHVIGQDAMFAPYGGAKMVTFVSSLLVGLDVMSHFARMYKGLVFGEESHKDGASGRFALLDLYYGNRKVMGTFCIGQEFCYIALYTLHFSKAQLGPLAIVHDIFGATLIPLATFCALKQVTNVLQFVDSMLDIGVNDLKEQKAKKGGKKN